MGLPERGGRLTRAFGELIIGASVKANAFYSPDKNGFFICLASIVTPMFDVRWPESVSRLD